MSTTTGATVTVAKRKKSRWLLYIVFAFAAFIALFAVVVVLQPDDFRVTRSTVVAGSPAEVFGQVNDHHNSFEWMPWTKRDPNAKITYEGASAGTGAIYRWDGNSEVGAGSSTIVESRPNELVRIRLEMLRPFAATNEVLFTFEPVGDQTKVTWDMSGRKNFASRAVGLILDMDKMVGQDFETGLANLKARVEAKPAAKVGK